jgi:hypothetical protein
MSLYLTVDFGLLNNAIIILHPQAGDLSLLRPHGNRQTSIESASLPQYLGCNTVFDMRLLHQRPIFFKANSIHSSIVAILELIRGAQCLIEVIRSSCEEM